MQIYFTNYDLGAKTQYYRHQKSRLYGSCDILIVQVYLKKWPLSVIFKQFAPIIHTVTKCPLSR